jgi:peptide/nickel transport system permease protein
MSALGEAGADLRSPPARRRGGEGAAGAARQASDSLSPTPSPERGGANAADYVETPARRAWRRLVRRRGAMVGLAVIILVILVALFAPLVAPYDPAAQSWSAVRKAPSAAYWLGTDEVGRDLLSRIIFGARASLSAGVISVGIAIAIGVPLGLLAGYAGGLADGLISRITDAMLACPFLILAIALAAFLGPSLTNAMIAIGVTATPIFVRLTRGQVLSVKAEDYVEPALLVQATLTIATAVIAEASLSFLGLGQQPPAPSWGSMLNAAQRFLVNAPWMAVWPGLAIFVTVLSFNLLGDGLRDALDPRSSR